MSKFVENFKTLLNYKNISLRKMSKEVKISSNQLSKYINGIYEPSVVNADKIVRYFNVSLDFMFGDDDLPNRYSQFNEINIDVFLKRYEQLIKLRKTNYFKISKNTFINRNTMYNWYIKKIFPSIDIIARLAKELKTSIDYLVGRIDVMEIKY